MRLSSGNSGNPSPGVALLEPLEQRVLFSTIQGVAFIDSNGDALRKRKEPLLEGATIYLDLNDNRAFDSGEPSVLTDVKGRYKFDVEPGIYQVRDVRDKAVFDMTGPAGEAFWVDLRFRRKFKGDFAYWPLAAGPKPRSPLVIIRRPGSVGGGTTTKPDPTGAAPLVLYNTGATSPNNSDGTNSGSVLTGGPQESAVPYWVVERANPGGEPLPFAETFGAFNPNRDNSDLHPGSTRLDSAFIGPDRNGLTNLPIGGYLYATAFDLTGYEPRTTELTGVAVSDDKITDIRINGVSIGAIGAAGDRIEPAEVYRFAITTGFVAGVNTIQFLVENDGIAQPHNLPTPPHPTGLRVDGLRGTARPISAGPITLFNTGVTQKNGSDGTNATPRTAGVDPHWQVSVPGDGMAFAAASTDHAYLYDNGLTGGKFAPAFVATNPPPTDWFDDDINSGSPQLDSMFINPVGNGSTSVPGGVYIYRTFFDLTGLDPHSASVSGMALAADAAVGIYINGAKVQGVAIPGSSEQQVTPFTIIAGLVSGINVLDFVVTNTPGADSPSGLRVDGLKGTASGTVVRPAAPFPLRLPLPPFAPIQTPTKVPVKVFGPFG